MDAWVYDRDEVGLGEEGGFWSGLFSATTGYFGSEAEKAKAEAAKREAQALQSQSATQMIMAQLQSKSTMYTIAAIAGVGLVALLMLRGKGRRR